MKTLLSQRMILVLGLMLPAALLHSQNVAINSDGSLPNPNAMLDIKSTQKGLLIPRMGTASRLAIPNTKALLVYDSTTNSFWYNTGSTWKNLEVAGTNWTTKGNSGLATNNFIGTLDTAIFRIRVNNKQKMIIDTNGFVGIGAVSPTTAYTGLTLKKNTNNYFGSYIDAGASGIPFYGYALNGVAKAYAAFNGPNNSFEYHQTSDATPDFFINGNTKAVFNTGFLGVGTSTPTTSFTAFAMKKNINDFYGMYVDAGATGVPFYGYALNGVAKAYAGFSGPNNSFEYHQTSDATPDFFINGNTKAVFNTGFLGIGTSTPTSSFTAFAMKKNINDFYGMYVDAGTTGVPFYGYALNGVAKAYAAFNGPHNAFEYHQTSDATPDFFINGNTKAVFNTGFLGIGTSTPTSSFTAFAMKKNINDFYGMYVDAGATGVPFYGYALNGIAKAYAAFNGPNNSFEYHQTSDATPDFFINGNTKAVFNTAFVGIGTSTPTTGFTGFAVKSTANTYFGSYIDAGSTGIPFYGYALNGIAKAYVAFNGPNNSFEYHQTSDATPDFFINGNTKAVFNTAFVGIGTSTQTTSSTGFVMKKNINGFYGMYVDAGATGEPFYGYALNGSAVAWTELNGGNSNWQLNYNGVPISVTSTGNVGIGTGTPAVKLDVNGNIRCVALTETSDARFKQNIEPLQQSLDKIEQLQGVTWNWKTAEYPGEQFTNDKQIGFVAQDVEKVLPEVVATDKQGYKSIDYAKISAVLVEAVKEQQQEIDRQKKENEDLRKLIEQLAADVNELKANAKK